MPKERQGERVCNKRMELMLGKLRRKGGMKGNKVIAALARGVQEAQRGFPQNKILTGKKAFRQGATRSRTGGEEKERAVEKRDQACQRPYTCRESKRE